MWKFLLSLFCRREAEPGAADPDSIEAVLCEERASVRQCQRWLQSLKHMPLLVTPVETEDLYHAVAPAVLDNRVIIASLRTGEIAAAVLARQKLHS